MIMVEQRHLVIYECTYDESNIQHAQRIEDGDHR